MLSICTTNYNCAHALHVHLDSVFGQLEPDEFEYIVVDSKSKDDSVRILREYGSRYRNLKIIEKKCNRGVGRKLAYKASKGDFIVQVDTDTRYYDIWKDFLRICTSKYPGMAIQAMGSGVFPRKVMDEVDSWGNYQYYDDFELWMKVFEIGKIKWYPVFVGENLKELDAFSHFDVYSSRYGKIEKLMRLVRHEFDWVRLHRYRDMDLIRIWKDNSVDLGLGKMEENWFGDRPNLNLRDWSEVFTRKVFRIMRDHD
jgi:glycosyltransferase involved in cell wall biosynthesis